MVIRQKITLQYIPKPGEKNQINKTYWFCNTLGLSSGRDTENLSNLILLTILKERGIENGMTTEQIAQILNISIGRVNHHLRNLFRSGFIYREKKLIRLRGSSLQDSVKELRKDVNRILDELESVARDIDADSEFTSKKTESHALIVPIKPRIQRPYNPDIL